MEQLFDDLDDFGAFDDAISGDVRDPYTELARLRHEEPVQRLETSGRPPGIAVTFIVYRHEDVSRCCATTKRFLSGRHRGLRPVGEGAFGMDDRSWQAAFVDIEGVLAEVISAVGR